MNAGKPLVISTRDGSGQCVHPDVAIDADNVSGHHFVMVCTPYPWGDDRLENPCLRVSDDGLTWHALAGAPDPLIEAPADPDSHNADPDIVITEGRFYVFYMTRNKRKYHTTFSVIESTDCRHWTSPRIIYEDTWGVSPAVVVSEGAWRMWYVWLDLSDTFARSQLRLREGRSPYDLGNPRDCSLDIRGYVPWHIDVMQREEGQYEALIAAYPINKDNSRTSLFHCTSSDGVTFALSSPNPVITPSTLGWDGMMVYRSSFIADSSDYRIWYTGGSWNRRFGIGHVTGPIHKLINPEANPSFRDRVVFFSDNLAGLGKYTAKRLLRPVLRPLRRQRGG